MAETPISREAGSRQAVLASILAWLLPGAGHFYLRRKARGLLFFVLVVSAVVLGYVLNGLLYRPVAGQPLSILGAIAQLGFGIGYAVLRFVGFSGDATAAGFEYGKAFLITAGLLNYLLVLDAWDIAQGKKP